MTSRRSIAPIVFVTITAYSALMLALAAFVLHPPALGWIGLALATVAAWLAGAAVVCSSRVRGRALCGFIPGRAMSTGW